MNEWEFESTGEAYDASQTRDEIKDGDLLIVKSEGVYGFLNKAWPIAVVGGPGEFHTFADNDSADVARAQYAESIQAATERAMFDAQERECGMSITYGPREDPYGASCDLPREDHPRDENGKLLHEGDDSLADGRIRWTGGGSAAGDPLPFHIVEHINP